MYFLLHTRLYLLTYLQRTQISHTINQFGSRQISQLFIKKCQLYSLIDEQVVYTLILSIVSTCILSLSYNNRKCI